MKNFRFAGDFVKYDVSTNKIKERRDA
jgi:hypothetical protein